MPTMDRIGLVLFIIEVKAIFSTPASVMLNVREQLHVDGAFLNMTMQYMNTCRKLQMRLLSVRKEVITATPTWLLLYHSLALDHVTSILQAWCADFTFKP